MKFSFKSFVAGIIIATVGVSAVFAAGGIKSASFNSYKVILDGKELDLGGQQMISVVKDGEQDASNYMPVRGVLEAMGYKAEWDGQGKAVIVTSPQNLPVSTPKPTAAIGKVYLITMDRYDPHWIAVDAGARAVAADLKIEYKWDTSDYRDNTKQIEAINNAVADGADVILLSANDIYSISPTIANAKAKGVQFIYVDSQADEPAAATFYTDEYAAGQTAAKAMLDELKEAGKTSGKIGIIGVNTLTSSTMAREKGFREVMAKDGRFILLTTEYTDGDASLSQDAAQGFITGNSNLVGILGINEGTAVGAGIAIKDSGKPIIGIGFDKSDAIQTLLERGNLKAAIIPNPYAMGELGMQKAYDIIKGNTTGPANIDTGVTVLIGK